MTFSDLWPRFQGHHNSTSKARKWYNIYSYTYNAQPIESCKLIWSIKWRHFQWSWTTPNPGFRVTPFCDAENLRNSTRYRHNFNGVLTGTYTRPTRVCRFQWRWVASSDLLSKIFNDTKCRRVSLRQLSFLFLYFSKFDHDFLGCGKRKGSIFWKAFVMLSQWRHKPRFFN